MNYLKRQSFSIHHRNIQSLAIKLHKFFHGLSPSMMKNVFHFNTNIPYNPRSRSGLYSRNPKTVKYGTETITYLAPKLWSNYRPISSLSNISKVFEKAM